MSLNGSGQVAITCCDQKTGGGGGLQHKIHSSPQKWNHVLTKSASHCVLTPTLYPSGLSPFSRPCLPTLLKARWPMIRSLSQILVLLRKPQRRSGVPWLLPEHQEQKWGENPFTSWSLRPFHRLLVCVEYFGDFSWHWGVHFISFACLEQRTTLKIVKLKT